MGTEIGEINETEDLVIQWKIENFFGLSAKLGEVYYSPSFTFANEHWYLAMYPNGKNKYKSEGYIGLYLWRQSSGPLISLECNLELKSADGQISFQVRKFTYNFQESEDYGYLRFFSRSELLRRKNELTPCTVSVSCTLKASENLKRVNKAVTTSCSYCKDTLDDDETVTSHLQKCEYQVKCPECGNVFPLKNCHKHQCQSMGAEATVKLLNDFKSMMLTGDHSDTIIQVKGEEFRLHRNVLASRSPYFHSMFNCSMKEKNTGVVTVDDCEPDVFRYFIYFLYTGNVDKLTFENVSDLYELADKYQEDQMKSECRHFMMNRLSIESFCDFTALAFRHDEKELLENSIRFFASKMKEIILTARWQTLMAEYPTQANELLIKALK